MSWRSCPYLLFVRWHSQAALVGPLADLLPGIIQTYQQNPQARHDEKLLSNPPHSGLHNQRIALALACLLNRTLLFPLPVRFCHRAIPYYDPNISQRVLGANYTAYTCQLPVSSTNRSNTTAVQGASLPSPPPGPPGR